MLNQPQNHNKLRAWLKRFGFFGFMFFFIKGLGWIALVYFGIKLFLATSSIFKQRDRERPDAFN